MNAQEFAEKWSKSELKETASYTSHFEDVCRLLDHPTPSEKDPKGEFFTYQAGVKKDSGKQGFADVWYDKHFAIEYKGKGKDLREAYQQLLQYRESLNNPPLLVVTDFEQWEVHTNWQGTEKHIYRFSNADIPTTQTQKILRAMFYEPALLHPDRDTASVTEEAAKGFQLLADNMRDFQTHPERIGHFLTKLVFCLFAEDIGLLPTAQNSQRGLFSAIIENTHHTPERFVQYMQELFTAMADGGEMMFQSIPYFNGNLFEDVNVERLTTGALLKLRDAARLNWQSIEPAIFGTLFERSLDPRKRAQLGAHYTSQADIKLIVEPVLMQPLRREWVAIQAQATPLREHYEKAATGREKHSLAESLLALRDQMLHRLRTIKVLDPACGSGNFLYIALRQLLDLEKEVIKHPLFHHLSETEPEPQVHPKQLFGMEKDDIAHSLASIVVWIGYIQWRFENGYWHFREPILTRLDHNIRHMDAILDYEPNSHLVEPLWEEVDVIVGNPPFLGGSKMRGELGDRYVDDLWKAYDERVPKPADLVCYWFEKARQHLEEGKAKRVGLISTNSIRGGANREVLERIKKTGDIFLAWSDHEWILDGAAVRISLIGFDNALETEKCLDGQFAQEINSDLTSGINLTSAKPLSTNKNICYRGNEKHGAFDISPALAQEMLHSQNKSGRKNSDVIQHYINASDVVNRNRGMWIIDFVEMALEEASQYEKPFAYIQENVKPVRDSNNRKRRREYWWQHGEIIPKMRRAIQKLDRYIVTPAVSKHRIFAWMDGGFVPDHQLHIFAREDDYFFGVLHSKLHEVWSLRMGTWLGKGNDPRYTPTTTFETFPFPWSPRQEPIESPEYRAIAEVASQLHQEREAWLNPPNAPESVLKKRTLTELYNALNVWRGKEKIKTTTEAANFAPRLDDLHRALDEAVCRAYGWDITILEDEESMLTALLSENLKHG